MDKLQQYAERRDFERTPEPAPGSRRAKKGELRFVVQAHAARAMHYDFRLQVGDVLVSWAVPKGPSLDPKDKRLAVRTEDHPLEYAAFEGMIPKGQYGGGGVIVWDEGTWEMEGDPDKALEEGKLRFVLHGQKLRGRFHLTRTRSRGGKETDKTWLLIKGRDEAARSAAESIVTSAPRSVLSGRTLEEVKGAPRAVWTKSGEQKLEPARAARFPAAREPQLATLVEEPPEGDGYVHEVKLDGYRVLAEIRSGEVKLWSRGKKDFAARFPSVVKSLAELSLEDALLDGEVVALDEKGLTHFQALQNGGGGAKKTTIAYVVFDLLYANGVDVRKAPLLERKELLAKLLGTSRKKLRGVVRYSDHVRGHGPEFFAEACQLGMEGVVSKRVDAPYSGTRSHAWLKSKCMKRQEFVIGGYTDPSGSRRGFGALLVGLHDERGKLKYAGKVGTGFSERSLKQIKARLSKLVQDKSPFDPAPRGAEARGVHWVKPELLAEVTFSEVTEGGKLRHPSFQGLREDKSAEDIGLEEPSPLPADAPPRKGHSPKSPRTEAPPEAVQEPKGATTKSSGRSGSNAVLLRSLTHPDRVLFHEQGLTKRDLAEYYVAIADRMLPHVAERLLTIVRCPGGEGSPCFFQKHGKKGLPEGIHEWPMPEGGEPYLFVRDAAGLVGLVQLGVLEIHVWGSRIDSLECPDRLIFDLDPDPDLDWARLVEGALDVRDELGKHGLESFVKTTGGKGVHLVVPVEPVTPWPEAKKFCKTIAETLTRESPKRFVATMTKQKRKGKIFIDYLRNAREATAIAAYSTRARPGAPISTPVAWEELARDLRGEFRLEELLERLAHLKGDPWPGFFEVRQRIPED